MITIDQKPRYRCIVEFIGSGEKKDDWYVGALPAYFKGDYLETCFLDIGYETSEYMKLIVGIGDEKLETICVKELGAKISKELKEKSISHFCVNLAFLDKLGIFNQLSAMVEGLLLGLAKSVRFNGTSEEDTFDDYQISLYDISSRNIEKANQLIKETITLTRGICFARDMVNYPGNLMRPMDFAESIISLMRETTTECDLLVYGQLKAMGMEALASVGSSSEYPPCFLILTYQGGDPKKDYMALIGKGVTCDTGGYCLKKPESMAGIKGDMAGAAAVAASIYALAANKIPVNVKGYLPICENRISRGSLLPGDVISSYEGKTIEVCNTDAEGRLILADATSYAANDPHIRGIVDIATLTGSIVQMLGFSTAAALSNDDGLWESFLHNTKEWAGEAYLRIPYTKEHLIYLKSEIADIKNMGPAHCQTITAGLFIQAFTKELPWIHLDIAGTAWVDYPLYEYQKKGATGAGVSSLYYFLKNGDLYE